MVIYYSIRSQIVKVSPPTKYGRLVSEKQLCRCIVYAVLPRAYIQLIFIHTCIMNTWDEDKDLVLQTPQNGALVETYRGSTMTNDQHNCNNNFHLFPNCMRLVARRHVQHCLQATNPFRQECFRWDMYYNPTY